VALSGLQQSVSALCLPFGPAAGESLHVVLAVMAAMWQVAEGYFLDSQSSGCCLIHLLVTEGIWYGWRSERRKRMRGT